MKKIQSKQFYSILLFSALFLAHNLPAETIYMKDGTELNGKIVAQSRTEIKININGKVQLIKKDAIRRIQYGKSAAEIQKEKDEAEKEKQKQAADEEARKKAEADLMEKEQAKEKKEKELLAEEEEKKQKQLAKEQERNLKKEKIAPFINKHELFVGMGAGRAAHHFAAEDVLAGLNKSMLNVNFPSYRWTNTDMNVRSLLIHYNRRRLFIDFDYTGGSAKPRAEYYQRLTYAWNTSTNTDLYFHEDFNSLRYDQATSVFGYKLFLGESFEISPVVTLQKSSVKGNSHSDAPGTELAQTYHSLDNQIAYEGNTAMGGLHFKYRFSFPLEIDFQLQARKTRSNFSLKNQKTVLAYDPGSDHMILNIDIAGKISRYGGDASLKTKYTFENGRTSLFLKFYGYRENGKFTDTNFQLMVLSNGNAGFLTLAGMRQIFRSANTYLNTEFSRNNMKSGEAHGGAVFGIEQKFDFNN